MSKKRTSDFYKNLVPFFIGAYPNVSEGKAQKLGQCALAYFHSLLVIDGFVDGEIDIRSQPQKLFEAIGLLEKSIRNLAFLIPEKNSFWRQFDDLKKQYAQAVFYEKELSATQSEFTEETFENLAFGKSAICCGIIYGLQALCKNTVRAEGLNTIIKHIHIAFQYLDDISDFKQDIEQGQWTYPHFLVNQVAKENGLLLDNTMKNKYLFLSGIAENMVEKAGEHYDAAALLSKSYGLYDLNTFIIQEKAATIEYVKEIQLLMDKTAIKVQKSYEVITKQRDIKEVVNHAIEYLMANAKKGFWEDFMTSAGHGKTWISAYVGVMLADIEECRSFLKKVLTNLSEIGSYNESILQDADSSTFLVGFYYKMTGQIPESLLKSWLLFQNPNGGWATYRDETTLRQILDLDAAVSVKGWFVEHDCVSAAAGYILADISELNSEYEQTCRYISKKELNAYWWTSDVYTRAFALLALSKQTAKNLCNNLVISIIEMQHKNGYWANPSNNEPNAYYTALALKALLNYNPHNYKDRIDAAANWLINNQMTDGSWQADRILRIPATNVINPKTVSRWRQSSFGVNALSDDYNRVFTTSTAINALNCYAKL